MPVKTDFISCKEEMKTNFSTETETFVCLFVSYIRQLRHNDLQCCSVISSNLIFEVCEISYMLIREGQYKI